MNDDLLICIRRAVAMTTSEQPLLGRNGKKKGYIKIMKELLGCQRLLGAWILKSKLA